MPIYNLLLLPILLLLLPFFHFSHKLCNPIAMKSDAKHREIVHCECVCFILHTLNSCNGKRLYLFKTKHFWWIQFIQVVRRVRDCNVFLHQRRNVDREINTAHHSIWKKSERRTCARECSPNETQLFISLRTEPIYSKKHNEWDFFHSLPIVGNSLNSINNSTQNSTLNNMTWMETECNRYTFTDLCFTKILFSFFLTYDYSSDVA